MAPIPPTGSQGARIPRIASLAAAVLAVSGVLLAGCTSGAKDDTSTAPSGRPTATSTSTPQDSAPSRADRAAVAEDVQQTLSPRLTANEQFYGSGTNSPCSTSRSSMFTSACQDAADVAGQDAAQALAAVAGKTGFATLRSTATRLQKAVGQYTSLGCAHGPGDTSVRHQCLAPAAQIAQGESDLREGVDMGLSGR